MSYTVTIVVPPIPDGDPEAWRSVDALRKISGPRPAVFDRLHERLVSRFPCITTLPDDEVDDGVWSDGPLIEDFGHRVAVLGITTKHDEVMPFLVENALAVGLIVLDPQTRAIHRPRGQVTEGGGWLASLRRLIRS